MVVPVQRHINYVDKNNIIIKSFTYWTLEIECDGFFPSIRAHEVAASLLITASIWTYTTCIVSSFWLFVMIMLLYDLVGKN